MEKKDEEKDAGNAAIMAKSQEGQVEKKKENNGGEGEERMERCPKPRPQERGE